MAPTIILIYSGILLYKFGLVGFLIDIFLILLLAFIFYYNNLVIKKTKVRVSLTDDRSSKVSEFVQKIRHIKIVGMEPLIEQEIFKSREKECEALGWLMTIRACFDSLLELSPSVVVILALYLEYTINSAW